MNILKVKVMFSYIKVTRAILPQLQFVIMIYRDTKSHELLLYRIIEH